VIQMCLSINNGHKINQKKPYHHKKHCRRKIISSDNDVHLDVIFEFCISYTFKLLSRNTLTTRH